MAPSFSRVSSGALLLALAYNVRPVNADFWEDVDNCRLVLDDLPADITTDFCHDWTYGYEPEDNCVTITGPPVTVTEYPDAQTCTDEGGYTTTTKEGYQPSNPTSKDKGSETTKVPDEGTKVPDETTKAPDQPPPTDVPEGGYDVTVTSTTWTTYWTTSTIYPDSPTATPAPYRRHARDVGKVRKLQDRASWCDDRPCRLVQYDDDTINEACKKYLGWEPYTSTVNVPGYTVVVTSYPTDCKKKDDGYKPDPVPAYPTEKDDGYKPDPYPTETPEPYPEDPYPTKEPDYSTETPDYPEYPPETPGHEPEPYPPKEPDYEPYPIDAPAPYPPDNGPAPYPEDQPAPYPEDQPGYGNGGEEGPEYGSGNEDGHYNDGNAPWEEDGTDDYQQSDDTQPWVNNFDNNYSGPDGPLPWDDVDQTQELANAIDVGGYDYAANELGLDDAPWNALPVDFPNDSGSGGGIKRRDLDYDSWVGYSPEESYSFEDGYGGEDGVDYDEEPVDDYVVTYEEYGPIEEDNNYESTQYDGYEPEAYGPEGYESKAYEHESYEPTEDGYKSTEEDDNYDQEDDSYKTTGDKSSYPTKKLPTDYPAPPPSPPEKEYPAAPPPEEDDKNSYNADDQDSYKPVENEGSYPTEDYPAPPPPPPEKEYPAAPPPEEDDKDSYKATDHEDSYNADDQESHKPIENEGSYPTEDYHASPPPPPEKEYAAAPPPEEDDEDSYNADDKESYKPIEDEGSYPNEDYPASSPPSKEVYPAHPPPESDYPTYDDSNDSYPDEPIWVLPDSDEYEGDEWESDYAVEANGPPVANSYNYWGEDGVDY